MDRREFLRLAGWGSLGMLLGGCATKSLEFLVATAGIEGKPLVSPVYQIGLNSGHNLDKAMLAYVTLDKDLYGEDRSIIFDKPVRASKVSERRLKGLLFHNILVENLEQGSDYKYWIEGTDFGGTIKTAYGKGSSFNFIIEGDTQRYDIMPNFHNIRTRLVNLIGAEDDPMFVVNCGDVTQHGTVEEWLGDFLYPYKNFLMNAALYSVKGNHDYLDKGFDAAFSSQLNIEGMPLHDGDANYSFDCGDAHFVVLDSNHGKRKSSRKFLEKDLEMSDAKFNLVFYHHPFRIDVNDLPVSAVFCGHLHRYQRLVHWTSGIPHIITGGGGAKLGKHFVEIIHNRGKLRKRVKGSFHHYISMNVRKEKIAAVVKDDYGKVRDSFEILPKAI